MPARRPLNPRIQQAIQTGRPDLPARFLHAYQQGGTPTSLHLKQIADAAGTTPIWLMTGRPDQAAPTTRHDQEA